MHVSLPFLLFARLIPPSFTSRTVALLSLLLSPLFLLPCFLSLSSPPFPSSPVSLPVYLSCNKYSTSFSLVPHFTSPYVDVDTSGPCRIFSEFSSLGNFWESSSPLFLVRNCTVLCWCV